MVMTPRKVCKPKRQGRANINHFFPTEGLWIQLVPPDAMEFSGRTNEKVLTILKLLKAKKEKKINLEANQKFSKQIFFFRQKNSEKIGQLVNEKCLRKMLPGINVDLHKQ